MSLETQIMADIKQAMLAKDAKTLEALRAVKAQILLEKTKGASDDVSESAEIAILQRLVKQRKESAAIFEQNNRMELAEEERFQASVIEKYLPKPLSEEEILAIVRKIVDEVGASSIKDMGKVMGQVVKIVAGRADNATISAIIKNLLS